MVVSALWFIFAIDKNQKNKPMSKDTNFIGQPVYVQLLNLVDREKIKKISIQGGYDRYVKNWTDTPISWRFCSLC